MATAEFSKFAGILSAALSQHHLSGLELAQLEFHHLNAGDLGSIPGSVRSSGYGNGNPLQYSCSNYRTIALISHASKVILKILQARLQQYVNCELPDVQAGFRKGRGTRGQIANIRWIIEKAREFQKNIYFCFIDYAKAFDCVDLNKLWKILKEMGIPDHLTCLLRNLYSGH